jgi:hypothetical protein
MTYGTRLQRPSWRVDFLTSFFTYAPELQEFARFAEYVGQQHYQCGFAAGVAPSAVVFCFALLTSSVRSN